MKSFQQFILEAYDKDVMGRSQIRRSGEGGRIYPERKSGAQTKRTKAVGGGKTAPAKTYKTRKDAGVSNPKRSPSGREQQPTRERGSAALSAKAAQKKAYLERKKRESSTKDEVSGKDKNIDLKKSADKLLAKKAKKTVSPKYKPVKATGYTAAERQKITRAGRRLVKDIKQGKEKPISQYDPGIRKG